MWFNAVDPAKVTQVIGFDEDNYLRVIVDGQTLRLMRSDYTYSKKLSRVVDTNAPDDIANYFEKLKNGISYDSIKNMNTSCIISYKQSDEYRKKNLVNIIKHISKFKLNKFEIIVVEQDSEEKLDVSNFKNVKKIFIQNNETFNKGLGYNTGVDKCTGEYLFFCDCDIILPELFFINAMEKLKTCDVVDPYYNIFFYDENSTNLLIDSNYINFNKLDKHNVASNVISGGAFMINKNVFLEVGGFDGDCVGYGHEDDIFDAKLKTFNKNIFKLYDHFCYHIYHPKSNMEYYENQNQNLNLLSKYRTMTKEDLIEKIKLKNNK